MTVKKNILRKQPDNETVLIRKEGSKDSRKEGQAFTSEEG
jgi:hypothetical protein